MSDVNDSTPNVGSNGPETSTDENVQNEQQSATTQDGGNVTEKAQTAEAQLKRKFKLKVDGQEFEEEIDLNDEETLKRHLQMSKAAQKRMNEAAQIRKQAEEFFHLLKTNPKRILTDPNVGLDFKKLAEEYLAEEIQKEMLTPEQRELMEYRKKEQERKEHEELSAKEREQQESERLVQQYRDDYQAKIIGALEKGGVPKTQRTIKRMAELMAKNLDMGLDLEPDQLSKLVREDYLSEMKELFASSDGDTLLKLLGDDVANKIRKADLARLKQVVPQFKKPEQQIHESKPQRRMTTEEWLAETRKRAQS